MSSIEHCFNGLVGYCGSALLASKLIFVSILDPNGQLLPVIVSILGGILSGLLSKLLHNYFVNKGTNYLLHKKDCEILDLQNQIQKLSQKNG